MLTNHIVFILDRSGSMGSIRQATINAYNQQLKTIKSAPKDQCNLLTLATFSTIADEPIFFDKPVSEAPPLTDFSPEGNTALLDAVGCMIQRFQSLPDANDPNTSFLLIILSDGEENSSHSFTYEKISDLIQKCQDTKRWTFSYIGTNTDLGKVTEKLNIPFSNSFAYTTDNLGMKYMSSSTSASVGNYFKGRAGGQTCSTNFFNCSPAKSPSSTTVAPPSLNVSQSAETFLKFSSSATSSPTLPPTDPSAKN